MIKLSHPAPAIVLTPLHPTEPALSAPGIATWLEIQFALMLVGCRLVRTALTGRSVPAASSVPEHVHADEYSHQRDPGGCYRVSLRLRFEMCV